jgi:hypothetical protein
MDKRDDMDEWQKLEKELMVGLGSRWNNGYFNYCMTIMSIIERLLVKVLL